MESSSIPPESTRINDLSFQLQLLWIASLVVPGISLTIDFLLPTILLNKVDLPTLGLPQIVMIGVIKKTSN